MVSTATDVGGIAVVAQRVDGAAAGDVRTLAMDVRSKLDRPGAVLIAGVKDGKVAVVAAVNDAARERGVSANDLVRLVGTFIDGKGGGKADVAQGGGTDTGRLDEALTAVLHRGRPGGRRLMRSGVRLGLDPGDARIGVARSDPTGFLATPVETVRRGRGDVSRLRRARGRDRGRRGRGRAAQVALRRRGAVRGQGAGVRRSAWRGRLIRCRSGCVMSA